MAAHVIIDRRKNGKGKSSVNRQKFIQRSKNQIKEAVKKVIRDGKIGDIASSDGKKVNVPVKDLSEPNFHYGQGGSKDTVYTGNKEFEQGDRLPRPPGGGGGAGDGSGNGKGASKDGEGEDEFTFHLTKEEFLELFFEDLELPDLVKQNIATLDEYRMRRAGFVTDGSPSRLNIVRSMKQSKARRTALVLPKKKKLKELEKERDELKAEIKKAKAAGQDHSIESDRLKIVLEEIKVLKRKIKAIPFVDEYDLRYNHWKKDPVPVTQAVMFCIMDVSGSMGEWEKEMSKRFFMLLYLFLIRSYDRVELVFIRHHTTPKEVEEEEFFYSKETGGTIVSSALQMMHDIIQQRFPVTEWNIYGCQASDGDNWPDDCVLAQDILANKIMREVQYYAYVEIDKYNRGSDLWPHYEQIANKDDRFNMTKITDASDIYPVFRKLFEKKPQ